MGVPAGIVVTSDVLLVLGKMRAPAGITFIPAVVVSVGSCCGSLSLMGTPGVEGVAGAAAAEAGWLLTALAAGAGLAAAESGGCGPLVQFSDLTFLVADG